LCIGWRAARGLYGIEIGHQSYPVNDQKEGLRWHYTGEEGVEVLHKATVPGDGAKVKSDAATVAGPGQSVR